MGKEDKRKTRGPRKIDLSPTFYNAGYPVQNVSPRRYVPRRTLRCIMQWNHVHAPKLISGKTSNVQYRDVLRRLIMMIYVISQSDQTSKGIRCGAGHLTYLACDNDAQCILQEAGLDGRLYLNGSDTDPKRTTLVNIVVKLIAAEYRNERAHNELACLKEIQACHRKQGEPLSSFLNSFKGNGARFSV